MSFLRFLMLLSLVVWIGGLIFFAFVLAPTAFQVLPNTHLAGNVVGRSLGKLHWLAIISGIVFLITSLLYSRVTGGLRTCLPCGIAHRRHARADAVIAVLDHPRMDSLRASVGDFAAVPLDNPARVQFDALHVWSTRVEGAVLVLGLVAVYLTAGVLVKR